MNLSVDVIKHNGKRPTERFIQDKLYDSICAACLSVHTPTGQAESIANAVCKAVVQWLESKPEVTSYDIRSVAARALQEYHPEAAYLYKQHKITI